MLEGDGTCAALQPLSTRDGADRLRLGLIGDLAAERELPEGLRGGVNGHRRCFQELGSLNRAFNERTLQITAGRDLSIETHISSRLLYLDGRRSAHW